MFGLILSAGADMPISDNTQNKNHATTAEVLTRATLALRYARRQAISQPMVDAMGELLSAYYQRNEKLEESEQSEELW